MYNGVGVYIFARFPILQRSYLSNITPQPLETNIQLIRRYESCDIRQCGSTRTVALHDLDHTYMTDWTDMYQVMECPGRTLLTGCRCLNEHCYGVEMLDLESSLPNSCAIVPRPDPNHYHVATKGNITCFTWSCVDPKNVPD